jgi:hypothetical protein
MFFIASIGGCATLSLANLLNSISPKIKCYHSYLGFYQPQKDFRSQNGEVDTIKAQIALSTDSNMIVVSIHAVYSGAARNFLVKKGGKCAVLFRNPILRSFSMLNVPNGPPMARDTDTLEGRRSLTIIQQIYGKYFDKNKVTEVFNTNNKIVTLQYNFIIY